jgi:hypothetical protein
MMLLHAWARRTRRHPLAILLVVQLVGNAETRYLFSVS